MSKRLVIVLVILVFTVAALPPLFGIAYERQIRSQIDSAPENPYLRVELADYERGLYSSEGSLRLAFSDQYIEQLRAALATQDRADPLTAEQQAAFESLLDYTQGELRFDIDVLHGPVAIADGVSVGLARVRSELDSATGKLAEFREQVNAPYLFRAEALVGFDGSSDFQYVVPPMFGGEGNSRFEFSGFNAAGHYDGGERRLKAVGGSSSFKIEREGTRVVLENLEFETDSRLLSNLLWLGKTGVGIRDVRVFSPGSAAQSMFSMHKLGMDLDFDLNESADKLSMEVNYQIAGIIGLPETDLGDLQLRMRLSDVDLEATKDYIVLYQRFGLVNPESMGQFLAELEPLAERILRGSPRIEVEPVKFTLNGEQFLATLGIEFDGDALPADTDVTLLRSNPGLLLGALSAQGRIETSESIAKMTATSIMRDQIAKSIPPDMEATAADVDAAAHEQALAMIDSLIQQGMIRRDEALLSTNFEYTNGELVVNGTAIALGRP